MNKDINFVVLTGAGISKESGINTFRDQGGLWEGHKIEDVATYTGFVRNPSLVYKFYHQRLTQLNEDKVKVNEAHLAIANLERSFPDNFTLITQNVDDLHERAGSENILHMHGELKKMKCLKSSQVFPCTVNLNNETRCSCCSQSSRLRPDIIWFGETPYHLDKIQEALSKADYFISIGTSAEVYPAAMFINMIPSECTSIEINIEKTAATWRFKDNYLGKATKEVPVLIEKLIKKHSL